MKYANVLLKVATAHGVLIGLYHIILPYQWGWSRFTQDLPPIIEWSLFALNLFFSVLLILLTLLGGMTYRFLDDAGRLSKMILLAIATFWAIDVGYQLLNPVPAPQVYWYIKPLFLGAAILNFCMYIVVIRSFMLRTDVMKQ